MIPFDPDALSQIARCDGWTDVPNCPDGWAAVVTPLRDDYDDVSDFDRQVEAAGLRAWVRPVLPGEWPPSVLLEGMPPPTHVLVRVLASGVRVWVPVVAFPLATMN